MYFVKARTILKKLYPANLVWKRDSADTVYLTFDDGPHLTATTFVLDELEKYGARATFFCIGKNVIEHPQLFHRLTASGHQVANHTHTHPNGWKTSATEYLENTARAAQFINSKLFRPPYGKIKRGQAKRLEKAGYKIIMWDVLCGDFDQDITPEKCWENIALNIEPGSIVVFHDSEKAWENMRYALPRTLAFCAERNWKMESL